jgi:primosomal protein N'
VGRWRQQILLRGEDLSSFRNFLRASVPSLHQWSSQRGLRVSWDVDPRHLL